MEKIQTIKIKAKIAIGVLWVVVGFNIVLYLAQYMYHQSLVRLGETISGDPSPENLAARDSLEGIVGYLTGFYVALYIVCGIIFLSWLTRSYYNFHFIVKRKVRFLPGLAMIVWFVPIMNLYAPYQVMEDMYLYTDQYLNNKGTEKSKMRLLLLPRLWWGGWLLSIVLSLFSMTISMYDHTEKLISLAAFYTASCATAFLATRVISEYTVAGELLIKANNNQLKIHETP